MDIIQVITKELNVEKWQVEAAVKLIDEGCTIPFISRYRKEATGSLNDEQLRSLHERLLYLRNLEDKKTQVLGSIEEQGKLTPELKKQIQEAQTLVVVEDLYRPYRPKRRTRAIIAKEKGLEPLANILMLQMTEKTPEEEAEAFVEDLYRPYRPKRRTRAIIAKEKGLEPLANILMLQMTEKTPEEEAEAFVSEEKGVADIKAALDGAKDIIAEHISDEADYRIYIRKLTVQKGTVVSSAPERNSGLICQKTRRIFCI